MKASVFQGSCKSKINRKMKSNQDENNEHDSID
jgi:hypothetical protein